MKNFIFVLLITLLSCESESGNEDKSRTINIEYNEVEAVSAQYKYLLTNKKVVESADFDISTFASKMPIDFFEYDGNLINLKDLKSQINVTSNDHFILLYSIEYQCFLDVIPITHSTSEIAFKTLNIVDTALSSNSYNILSEKTIWNFSNANLINASVIISSNVTNFQLNNFVGTQVLFSASNSATFISYTMSNVTFETSTFIGLENTITLSNLSSFDQCYFLASGTETFLFNANSSEITISNSAIINVNFFMNGANANYQINNVFAEHGKALFEFNVGSTVYVNKAVVNDFLKVYEFETGEFELSNVITEDIGTFFIAFRSNGTIDRSHIETTGLKTCIQLQLRSSLHFADSINITNSNIISKYFGNDINIEKHVQTNVVFEDCYFDFGNSALEDNFYDRDDIPETDTGDIIARNPKTSAHQISF